MASSGKKGKKTKGKTLALTDFLLETPGVTATLPIRKSTLNWADEVEDAYDSYESRQKANVVLPTAPKAARGLDDYSDRIPQQPPYIAYLSNLPYDVDEDEIAEFFGNLKIADMRIPKEDRPGEIPRLKGYGYVKFEDRDSLLGALAIPDCTLKSRRIRIEVATNSENERKRGGRMEMGRDRPDRPEVSMGDWRSGPRSDMPDSDRRGGMGGGNTFSRDSYRDGPSIERDRPGGWRDSSDRPSFRDSDRDRGFSRDSDRDRGFNRDSDRDRGFSRDSDRDRGFSRDSDRFGRDSDRGFSDRGRFSDRDGDRRGFGSRRNDRDDRNGGFTRGGGRDEIPTEKSEMRTRPKLVLAPRTKPLETTQPEGEPVSSTGSAPSTVPAASIFGSAKPVDTSARERQIEERLAKETEQSIEEPNVDNRRDNKWDDNRSRRRDADRRSPRRGSPNRHLSPRYPSSRDGSPDNRRNTQRSPNRRASSPIDRRSPDSGRGSPEGNYRGNSQDSNRNSLDRRRRSPEVKGNDDAGRDSSNKRSSPERRRNSPDRRQSSPERKRYSPDRRHRSPDGKRVSPVRNRGSSDHHRQSPDRIKSSSERRKGSPDGRRISPDRKAAPRKNDDKRSHTKSEKPPLKERTEKTRHRDQEREMPKLKEPEPPNFASSNKYAFLQAEEDSDE